MLALQNGIDATDRIARAASPHAVLAGVAYVLSVLQRPGVIKHVAHGRIVLGDPFGGAGARHDRVAQALRPAGIGCETAPDIHVPLWEKFVLLAGTGGVMALTRLR